MEKQKSREYQSLKRDINGLLKDFERNKEWADFSNWLHRLHEDLMNKRFSELPQQITLCKRLAQCLNPSLPAGVHSTALKVYEVILKNFSNKVELLPLLALGLFPFFEHSNSQNKIALIKLLEEHFASETECVQMVVGLMNALLTGLNENSEDLAKRIYSICEKLSKSYGRIWVDGAVWINILKSPKVRLAGFKYFMKVFKDRDRLLLNAAEEGKVEEEKVVVDNLQIRIENSQLNEEEKVLLMSIHGYRNRPDDHLTRFPNFSSLIVNTLCVCLDNSAQNMIKRSALDLLINYLKLSNRTFGKKQGVILLQMMLQLLQCKEYNLTNRVYKYLFDQPNAEGIFHIDHEKKSYELEILQEALSNLLVIRNNETNIKEEGVLLIIEIIVTDHPSLADYLLKKLSFHIVFFIRDYYLKNSKKEKIINRAINDFYLNIITRYKRIFLQSIMDKINILKEEQLGEIRVDGEKKIEFITILDVLQFYFNKLEKITNVVKPKRKGSMNESQEMEKDDGHRQAEEFLFVRSLVLRELIHYLFLQECRNEKIALATLDLCNEIYLEYVGFSYQHKQEVITLKEIHFIEHLLEKESKSNRKNIYAKLITLNPHPKKEMLLPYIEDSSLSIVCINILIGSDSTIIQNFKNSSANKNSFKSGSAKQSFAFTEPIPLSKEEQQKVFFAIFKLLNCHLFEVRALHFIDRFRSFYGESFNKLIDKVEPSQWLIYWKKVDGNVSGGIIRMIENIDSTNSYHQHLSRKWIIDSQSIISKVIDPIYHLMDRSRLQRKMSFDEEDSKQKVIKYWNIEDYERIFGLMKLVFKATTNNFSKFFFLQKEKYLNIFILFIFKCIETDPFEIKSKSLEMLTFLLTQTTQLQQKFDMVNLTLPNVLSILEKTIDYKKVLEQQEKQKLMSQNSQQGNSVSNKNQLLIMSNLQIQLLEYVSKIVANINQLIKGDNFKQDELIRILKQASIYDIVLKGMLYTETPYIKTLYIDSSKELVQMIANLDKSKVEVTNFMNKILDKLFIMLKNTDMNTIQDIIKSRNENSNMKESLVRRKKSWHDLEDKESLHLSFYQENMHEDEIKHNLNLEEKYGEIIELWNSIKFYIQFAIKIELKEMPVINLLSLILQSFPFSYLKYTTAGGTMHQANLESLEEQINNVTGLKKEVLQIFEILWNKESRQILDFLIEKGDPRILIHSSLDPSKVLETFNKNSKLKQVLRYIKNSKFNLPKNTLHYNVQTLLKENQLFYFLYIYLLYCNMKLLRNRRINNFFEWLIDLLQSVKITPHIQSKFWIVEIIEVVSQRMMNNKEFNVENWSKLKVDLQNTTKETLDEIITVITKSKFFTHRTEIKTGLFNLFNKQEKQSSLFDFVKIFPPTIFENYERYKESAKKLSENKSQMNKISEEVRKKKINLQQPRQRLSSYILQEDNIVLEKQNKIDEFLFSQFLNRTEQDYINYLSLCGLRTLIRISNSLLINVYQKDLSKIILIIRQFLVNLLPICDNREDSNQHFNELIAEYLHTVMDHEQLRGELIKTMRKTIIEIYTANDFFKCTQKTLAHWRAVIDYCTDGYDLLAELLSKQGLFEGIFTKKAEATRQKIKSFERVCFVIYAGRVDKYENKLRTVLQSLNEVMKQENPSPALLILILFCIRILLMRLSAISLNKLFRSVWPSLITLLIQIFKKDRTPKNINLQLAAMKVIELIHALELQEFMLHKWMFIFDYFGLKIDPMGDLEDNMKQCQMFTPFVFKPFLTNVLPNNRFRCKFMPQKQEASQISYSVVKRRLIVKKPSVESDEQLKDYAILLMQYMMDLNESRAEIAKKDIENLIEDDFISLDYIFKIK